MIKIERITATKPTIIRNGVRQPVTLNMIITQAELDTLEAENGEILYTVDETEIKTVVFQPTKSTTPPVTKPEPSTAAVVTEPTPTSQPFVDTSVKETEVVIVDPRLTRPANVKPAAKK